MQNFLQLEVPGMKRDAAQGGNERTHVGFLTWGMWQGHLRDCAKVFSIYGFKPVPRLDGDDFAKKVYSQYAEMYTMVVESPEMENAKRPDAIWKKWINATYLNSQLWEGADDNDDGEEPTTGQSVQRKDLQKFTPSQGKKYNIAPQCHPSSIALLMQMHIAKLCESVLNVMPEERGHAKDRQLIKSHLEKYLSGAGVGKRDSNPKFTNGYSLSCMDRHEGSFQPRSLLDTCLVVFGRNYRESLSDAQRAVYNIKQKNWYLTLADLPHQNENSRSDYTLNVEGVSLTGDDEESSPKLNTAKKNKQMLKTAIEAVQFLERIINTDPEVGKRLKNEVNKQGFKDNLKEMTEFVQEKKKRGDNVGTIDEESQSKDDVTSLYSPSVKSRVEAYVTQLQLQGVRGQLTYTPTKKPGALTLESESDESDEEGSTTDNSVEIDSALKQKKNKNNADDNEELVPKDSVDDKLDSPQKQSAGENNEDENGATDPNDSATTTSQHKVSDTPEKAGIETKYYVGEYDDLYWDGELVTRHLLETNGETTIDDQVEDRTRLYLLKKYMGDTALKAKISEIWRHYHSEAAKAYVKSPEGKTLTKKIMVADLAEQWLYTIK